MVKQIETQIVTGEKRLVVDLGEWVYVYIPMSKQEVKEFATEVINPCWRIMVSKNQSV